MASDSFIKRLRVTHIIKETEQAATFELEPLDGWQPHARSGQFMTLVFQTPHGKKRRSYSLTSSPELGEPLRITVKKVDNGEFSRPLVYNAAVGDVFHTSGVGGIFTLPDEPWTGTYCFLAAGSGIAPCFSLIKTILAQHHNKVVLFYSNKNQPDAIFYTQLLQLRDLHPERLQVRFLFSDHTDIYNKRLSKWLLDQLLEHYLPDDEKALFYLCGPFEYMQTAEIVLLMRASRGHIIKENFSSLPRLVLPEPPDKEAHGVTIRHAGHTYQLQVQYPQSILKAAKQQNIELPYSCEAGRCSSCIATCTKGQVWLAYNEVLSDREVARGRILTCQGFPVGGDVEIRFDEES